MVYITCGLLVVAVGQGALFIWQLMLLRKTLEDSSKAIGIAERNVAVMEATAQRQLRAYVCIDQSSITFPEPGKPRATIVARNKGQTPALKVRHWIHQWVERYPLTIELPVPPADFTMAVDVLGPNGHHIMPIEHPQMIVKPGYLDDIGTDEATIYVYGEILYEDVFGTERSTKYRYMYGGTNRSTGNTLKPCPDGNHLT